MRLRKLEMKDAPYMLDWMKDVSVVEYMDTDFLSKTIEDCESFIRENRDDTSIHRAIVNDKDVYMGTVSLKNIDTINGCAEFAIIVRKDAMGTGYSKFGMDEMVKFGFEQLKLKKIYWYVSKMNKRAIRFYDKNGYKMITDVNKKIGGIKKEHLRSYYWYLIEKTE